MNIFLRKQGLGLESLRNVMASMSHSMRIARVDIPRQPVPMGSQGDLAINWGTMASTAHYTVVNNPVAVARTSNKGRFRKMLFDNGLSMHTILSPDVPVVGKYVLRPASHRGGIDLIVTDNPEDMRRNWYSGGYASLYIPKVREYRVFVAQNRIGYIIEKIVDNPSEVAWNVEQGGRFENLRRGSWNNNLMRVSLVAMKLSGLHFGAVDVIESADGKFYVLEINTAPALTGEYWISCVAKIFDYMIDKGTDNFDSLPYNDNTITWKHFLHPAFPEAVEYVSAPYVPVTTWDIPRELEEYTQKIKDHISNSSSFTLRSLISDDNTVKWDLYLNSTVHDNGDVLHKVTITSKWIKEWVEVRYNE